MGQINYLNLNGTAYDIVPEAFENIAPEYDITSTYNVGDCVIYDYLLYKCNTKIEEAEQWDSNHWDAVSVSEVTRSKADENGKYPGMLVGMAENLLSKKQIENQAPYISRAVSSVSDASDNIGNMEFLDEIVGGTVAWNQQIMNGNFSSTNSWVKSSTSYEFFSANNNIGEIALDAGHQWTGIYQAPSSMVYNHKYLLTYTIKSEADVLIYLRGTYNGQPEYFYNKVDTFEQFTIMNAICNFRTSGTINVLFGFQNAATDANTIQIKNVMIVDLTLLFGATIADYIYTLEEATTGAGVAWLRNHGFMTKDYYAYNAGSLESVQVAEKRTSGKNLLAASLDRLKQDNKDGTWNNNVYTLGSLTFAVETDSNDRITAITVNGTQSYNTFLYIKGLDANGQYKISGCPAGGSSNTYRLDARSDDNASVFAIDGGGDGAFFEYAGLIMAVIRIQQGVACNHLVFKPMIRYADADATFEPYEEHAYPLDSSLTLRGIMKLQDGKPYFDGDRYLADGTATRKFAMVRLADLTWTQRSTDTSGIYRFRAVPNPPLAIRSDAYGVTVICNCLEGVSAFKTFTNRVEYSISGDTGGSFLNVFASDLQTVEAWQNYFTTHDAYAVYELETPTIETAAPYIQNQVCSPYGTEQFVDAGSRDVEIPVGHKTRYAINMSADIFASAIKEIDTNLNTLNDQLVVNSLDGTKAKYNSMMKQWFLANGANAMSPTGITELCNKWYTITRNDWDGYTEFALPSESAVSTGTKGGDNAGLTCVPSTDVAANTDDYAGNPLFACVDVNYVVDETTLDIVITAIDGITDNFVRNDPTKFVGVMQMGGWHYYYDTSTTYVHGYADHQVNKGTCEPLPESVRVDGTIRPFVVHSKYMSKTVNNKMTSCAGLIPTAYSISHNSLHTLSAATGAQYSGGTIVDNSFLILMTYIKYGSLTLDGILQGCCAYNCQYYAKVAETGVKRVIVSQSQGANISVGSSLIIGNYAGNADRGQNAMYSISGQAGCVVTAVEDVTISGTTYKAIYVDTASTFNTAANGDAVNGTTVISTYHWKTGACDSVLGNDGSPGSATSGKYPAKLQGIEYMCGAYEVYADVILNLAAESGTTYYTPYVVKRSAQQATSITSNYTALPALKIACPDTDNWYYIKREGFYKGVFSPISVGGSSSTYTRDAMYMNKQGTTGTREWLAFGTLNHGSGYAGLSCLNGNNALGAAWWHIFARISPNGNRGEWTA